MQNTAAQGELARKSVLVIDDNTVLLRTVKDMLADKYDVSIATSGTQAFMVMQKRRPDIILLDYEMPYTNGGQVLAKLRSNLQTISIPVIFFTSSAERDVVQKLVQLKPDGYILKPPSREKLIKIIEKTLGFKSDDSEDEKSEEIVKTDDAAEAKETEDVSERDSDKIIE